MNALNVKRTALVLCANGSEESELVITIDMLRRAEIEVTVASVNGAEEVKCSRNVRIVPDCSLESVKNNSYDAIILPGGYAGTEEFCKSELAAQIVKKHDNNLKWICAICAAPLALKAYNIGNYKSITSHPSVKNALLTDSKYIYKEERVVKDENLITSRGPGTAFEFALTICEALVGKEKTMSIINPLMLKADAWSESGSVSSKNTFSTNQIRQIINQEI